MKIINAFFIIILGFSQIINAQSSDQVTIPFSGGSEKWIDVGIKYGKIRVTGSNRSDVLIKWEPLHAGRAAMEDVGNGLKRLNNSGTDLSIEESGNRIKVSSSNFTKGYLISVEMPSEMNLELSSFNEGDLYVKNAKGIVDLNTYNGKIEAENINGSVTANTFNGDIRITFDEITAGVPMSFDTYNGEVDLTLPPSTKASLKMKTKGGEILTGFDVALKKASSTKVGDEENGTRKIYLDGWVKGDINGGGPEFLLTNNWGNIYIRKGK